MKKEGHPSVIRGSLAVLFCCFLASELYLRFLKAKGKIKSKKMERTYCFNMVTYLTYLVFIYRPEMDAMAVCQEL